MISKISFALFLTLALNAKSPLDLFNKIDDTKKSLVQTNVDKTHLSKKMQEIALKIKKLNKEILELDKKLDQLDLYITAQKQKYQDAMDQINSINNTINAIDRDINQKKKEFAKKISRTLGAVVAKNNSGEKDEESILLQEIYEKYKNYNQQEILKLSKSIEQKKELKRSLIAKRDKISLGISNVQKQRAEYLKEQQKKKKLLAKLKKDEQIYAQRLKNIYKRQAAIRATLAKLNIVAKEAAKEAKKRQSELKIRIRELENLRIASSKNRKRALKEGKKVEYRVVTINSVKQYSSSYSTSNVTKYYGAKTIAPLRGAKIVKDFGTFIDPIYKIKSFNDSITLASRAGDNRVYNVLNGKVIYVGNNPMLGKMVVIEHSNNLHTIYADLDRISPFVKVGYLIRKGSVVGKIKRKLIFEATKNGKFINPKDLINL